MRISREEVLMESTRLWAKRSTCTRGQVGASIVREGRVLMSGYNGAPPGLPHCDHSVCTCTMTVWIPDAPQTHQPNCGKSNGCRRSIHAEQNAINYAARCGVATEGAEIYVTFMPCLSCAMSIISAGIVAVTYDLAYRDASGINLLTEAGIGVNKYPE